MTFIESNGESYKKRILSLVKMELAYINTKHEEFIANKYASSIEVKRQGRVFIEDKNGMLSNAKAKIFIMFVSNTKSYYSFINNLNKLICQNVGDKVPHWFVLTPKTLLYEKLIENKQTFNPLPLDGLKIFEPLNYLHLLSESNVPSSIKYKIALHRPDAAIVNEGPKVLEFSCDGLDDFNSWKESIAGVLESSASVRFDLTIITVFFVF